jgi:uncharacterized iron-regulated membrane protein
VSRVWRVNLPAAFNWRGLVSSDFMILLAVSGALISIETRLWNLSNPAFEFLQHGFIRRLDDQGSESSERAGLKLEIASVGQNEL